MKAGQEARRLGEAGVLGARRLSGRASEEPGKWLRPLRAQEA